MQVLQYIQYILKNCKKIDVLKNDRIEIHVYDCEDMQCRIVVKKHGQTLLMPIILCSYKDALGTELHD